ncbi:TlpA family protein disulfide reductase [Evansella halocellulosilytica]|uniref:TlpA family protein disulfide reductase n=1 Tax=Evansella halocellulosilytica TaxID=2011013 RepID=UPI000BB767C8|nr:TlpA disulfide reductase family protein [Evansella halocellulosilytica]
MTILKRIWFIIASISVIFFIGMDQRDEQGAVRGELVQIGHKAPNFTLSEISTEEEVTLYNDGAEYDGTIVYFWTSWCPYCEASMTALQKASAELTNIRILGINVTSQDRIENAKAFINNHDITFLNGLDEQGEVSQKYFVPPVPTTLFIQHDGTIVHRKVGALTNADISQGVQQMKGE